MLKKLFLLSTVASLAAFPALAQEATEPTTITPPAEEAAPAQPADQAPAADMTQEQPAADPAADPNAPATEMTQDQPTTEPAQPTEPATADAEPPAFRDDSLDEGRAGGETEGEERRRDTRDR